MSDHSIDLPVTKKARVAPSRLTDVPVDAIQVVLIFLPFIHHYNMANLLGKRLKRPRFTYMRLKVKVGHEELRMIALQLEVYEHHLATMADNLHDWRAIVGAAGGNQTLRDGFEYMTHAIRATFLPRKPTYMLGYHDRPRGGEEFDLYLLADGIPHWSSDLPFLKRAPALCFEEEYYRAAKWLDPEETEDYYIRYRATLSDYDHSMRRGDFYSVNFCLRY